MGCGNFLGEVELQYDSFHCTLSIAPERMEQMEDLEEDG